MTVRQPAPGALPVTRDGPTAVLARHAAELQFGDLPAEVVLLAKQCILDTVGVAIAAASEPVVTIVRRVADLDGSAPRASLLDGSGRRVSVAAAALVNATAAHATDFDDMYPAMAGHPSAPVVPAALALAEAAGATGAQLITAFVCGFEVEYRVGAAVMPSHYAKGFHPTGTAATFGAAAAAGHLLGLDPAQMEMALGIAASGASGLKIMFGTMTKPLHAGRAAASGVLAARLAAEGFTAAAGAIEGPQGFATTQSDALRVDLLRSGLGDPWAILDTIFKRHAACGYAHSVIDAMLAIREVVSAGAVEVIDLTVNPEVLAAAGIEAPATPLEAKFSVSYLAALAVVSGQVSAAQFTPERLDDPTVRELASRVRLSMSPSLPRLACSARVVTTSGQVLVEERDGEQKLWDSHPGEQTAPLTEKFVGLVEPVLGAAATRRLHEAILALDDVVDVRALLQGGPS